MKHILNNRLSILLTGILGNQLMVWAFDYLLYPLVIYKQGMIRGGLLMAFLSLVVCLLTLMFYDYTKKDWLGIETVKMLKETKPSNLFQKVIKYLLNKSELIALVILSIRFDPFITTVYLRRGAFEFNGMTKKTWLIFLSSVLISNVYWVVVVILGIDILQYFAKIL